MSSVTNISESTSDYLPGRYIITGGPGAGKTTIIKHLEDQGESVVHEAATDVIKQELANGISEPWFKEGFREKIVALQEERELEALTRKSRVFFDRSPIDTYTYCLRYKAEPTIELLNAVNKIIAKSFYNNTVFLIENLGFCETDKVRMEDQTESLLMQQKLKETYTNLGFRVISISSGPHAVTDEEIVKSVEDRVQAILSHLTGSKTPHK